ncbi:MAG: retropepsin-like aspartic protease [Oleiphilaceae bacterium]|nr:retropepsin-like aspartic protease [Oleiphilaceae bacterium]
MSVQSTGKTMMFIAWIIGIALLTQFFGVWEQQQYNPNQNPDVQTSTSSISITLEQNRKGHYHVSGLINGEPAEFVVDTGATDVVVPASLARKYGLTAQGSQLGVTANGIVEMQNTRIDEISFGQFKLYNVSASLNPGMGKHQPVLLGMSALRHLDIQQTGGKMTLSQYR